MRNQPSDLNSEQRAEQALRFRAYGMRWNDVAQRCGYPSADAAEKAVERLRKRTREASVMDYRYVLGERLAFMAANLYPKVEAGDLWAYDRMLAITEQQRKLFGADAPTEAENNATPYSKRITVHNATEQPLVASQEAS